MRPPLVQALAPVSNVNVKVLPVAPADAVAGTTLSVPSPPTGVRVALGLAVGVGVGTETSTLGCALMGLARLPSGSLQTSKTLVSGAAGAVAPGPPPMVSP